mmetsp:Transcript_28609/g.58471  ORF Transcript_28609/g.58471 Transcript_28609/m.58471 type:complete len:297 (+) Transcript_28609:81-971(+)
MRVSANIVIAYNVLTALMGLAIMGGSIYAWVTYNANGFDALVSMATIYVALAVGTMVFLMSFMGCYAAKNDKRALLIIYLFFLFLILLIEIAGAVVFAMFAGRLDANNSLTSSSTVEDAVAETAIRVNNGALSIYATCCSGCGADVCKTELTNDFTVTACGTTSDPFASNCTVVETCVAQPGAQACYQSTEAGQNLTSVPPTDIAPAVCATLTETSFTPENNTFAYDASPLVGAFASNAKSSSCGRGDPFVFRNNMYEYAAGYATTVMIIFAVFAGLQFLVFLAGCYVVCCGNKDD